MSRPFQGAHLPVAQILPTDQSARVNRVEAGIGAVGRSGQLTELADQICLRKLQTTRPLKRIGELSERIYLVVLAR